MGLNFLLGPVSYLFPAQPSQRMWASTGGLVPSVSRAHTSVILGADRMSHPSAALHAPRIGTLR